MRDLKFAEIVRRNRELAAQLPSERVAVTVLGNIMLPQLKDVLEYGLRTAGINADVRMGAYDNIVQESAGLVDSRFVVIFWELCNVIDGGQYRMARMSDGERNALEARLVAEIDLVMRNTAAAPLVLWNRFSAAVFSSADIEENPLERLRARLNQHLDETAARNVKLVDIDKVLARVSVAASVDMRYFYSSKALYSTTFCKEYVLYVLPVLRAALGKGKKALIFDCDNTLWKGIVGEDGSDGIEMSPATVAGGIFQEVQSLALSLSERGVLLGLCSKNNSKDVEDILKTHPDMLIRNERFVAKRVNWDDKAKNLRQIAEELNIGLDSIVFVDDSPFEVNYIKSTLPEVTVVQVPERLHEYPGVMREVATLFYSLSRTDEDYRKSDLYKIEQARTRAREKFADATEFLRSLGLKVRVHVNEPQLIARISQMTQKTNQFNLTTKRYTEGDISVFLKGNTSHVFALDAADRFGEYGITGLCIACANTAGTARIDTFLMSCRIIGRDIEFAFMDFVVKYLTSQGIRSIEAEYIPTSKNALVADMYDRLGFRLLSDEGDGKRYALDLLEYKPHSIDHVEVAGGRAD